jgi:hypothetical protein
VRSHLWEIQASSASRVPHLEELESSSRYRGHCGLPAEVGPLPIPRGMVPATMGLMDPGNGYAVGIGSGVTEDLLPARILRGDFSVFSLRPPILKNQAQGVMALTHAAGHTRRHTS